MGVLHCNVHAIYVGVEFLQSKAHQKTLSFDVDIACFDFSEGLARKGNGLEIIDLSGI